MGATYRELFKLYDLIQNGESKSVGKFLLEASIEVNTILPSKGISVLHLAVGVDPLQKSRECTELLLQHGGNPNLSNEDGVTPVHIAAIWGRLDNLKLLVECGGDLSLRDLDGLSALDYAAREEQWEVYDYLHNVIDLISESDESKSAYTIELDKILVCTDQVIAEYESKPEDLTEDSCRKSIMIKDWCESNSLVVNKLYPTILGDTCLIDDEGAPWECTGITLDLTTQGDTTGDSFKTCLSKRPDVEISGVQKLDATSDLTTDSKRISVYENFSLPGSPKSIAHRNYNTKTSIRNKTVDTKKSIESDFSLDRMLAMVQNRTNEWLSNDGVRASNTRRSSASSGVSSNYSGGSVVLATVQEEYRYEDKEEQVVLIEKRTLPSPIVLPGSEDGTEALPPAVLHSDAALRAALQGRGCGAGPLTASTRALYLNKLRRLLAAPPATTQATTTKTYSREVQRSLRWEDFPCELRAHAQLERTARAQFAESGRVWREGGAKFSFTYLLLDPRMTRVSAGSAAERWKVFLDSIFYVGKGKHSRPYAHLHQSNHLWKKGCRDAADRKVQRILDIWRGDRGVVCLHIFHNVIPAEAYTNEAAMIEAIGLQNLTNQKKGTYYGIAEKWSSKERQMLGLYLLYKAMQIFINEGERQLFPGDLE